MWRTWIVLSLAAAQVVLAFVLLTVGHRQVPQVSQDSPLFVGPAIQTSEAINAPVAFLEGGTSVLLDKAGIDFASDRKGRDTLHLAAVAFLWLVVGFEADSRLRRSRKLRRTLMDAVAISVGVALIFLARVCWLGGDRIMATGSIAWAVALVAICSFDLARFLTSRRPEPQPE
jgi:hypothetical protein